MLCWWGPGPEQGPGAQAGAAVLFSATGKGTKQVAPQGLLPQTRVMVAQPSAPNCVLWGGGVSGPWELPASSSTDNPHPMLRTKDQRGWL